VQAPLYRCLLGLVGRPALAEDLLQEVLLRVYRKIGALRDPALFRPWCYRIATREALRRLKGERRWASQLDQQEALDAVAAPALREPDRELLDALPGLLERVSPASRAVLALHYRGELSLEEVAEVLGLPLGTVKSRLAYGLAALRRLLAKE
jgi:RNA polymerase sigma-70 factor (ECF subfamily)